MPLLLNQIISCILIAETLCTCTHLHFRSGIFSWKVIEWEKGSPFVYLRQTYQFAMNWSGYILAQTKKEFKGIKIVFLFSTLRHEPLTLSDTVWRSYLLCYFKHSSGSFTFSCCWQIKYSNTWLFVHQERYSRKELVISCFPSIMTED